jgi:hypothetical protein
VNFVRSAASFDDGTGPALYALGSIFENEVGIPGVKKWDGQAWTSVGQRTPEPGVIAAYAVLHTFDDGRGEALYLGGGFTNINGVPCRGVCRFDGTGWETLGPGISGGEIYDMTSITTPQGPSLFVVGDFLLAGGGSSRRMAQWVGCPNCYANCDGSTVAPVLNVDDFTCFINKFAANDPYANCDQSTTTPVLNIDDFTCFITRFAKGCG